MIRTPLASLLLASALGLLAGADALAQEPAPAAEPQPGQAAPKACPSPPADDPIDFGPAEPLDVTTQSGARHTFSVEIADSPDETARGLMFRPRIEPDSGMLFLFPEPSIRSFYMRNTCASLDIIFLRPGGEIASIVRNAVPFSERSLPSPGMVSGVLELAAGRSQELGLAPGDRVVHARLGGEARAAD